MSTKRKMAIKDKKLNEFAAKLRKESAVSSENQLFDMVFNFCINENESIEWLVKVAKYGSYVAFFSGVLMVLIGIIAAFYHQFYLTLFGLICILHLIVGPMAYIAFEEGYRIWFMILTLLNLLWVGFASTYFISFLFIADNDDFDSNPVHHSLFVVYLVISVALEVCYVMLALKLINYLNEILNRLN